MGKFATLAVAVVFALGLTSSATAENVLDKEATILDEFSNEDVAVVSPYSLETALSMALEGAKGETAREIEEFLGLSTEEARKEAEETAKRFDEQESVSTANAFWHDDARPFLDSFVEVMKDSYDADVEGTNFDDFEKTTRLVNEWCSERTNGKIDEIVTERDMKNMEAVLTNALYVNAKWLEPLEASEVKETFMGSAGEQEVDFLHGSAEIFYENDEATAFGKKYDDGLTFVGILPKNEEFSMESLDLSNLLESETYEYEVNVSMPKFEVEFGKSLKGALIDRGVVACFDDVTADFSGMADMENYDLMISDVLQKSVVSVDENGTEAASATAILMTDKCMPAFETKSVKLDRTFAFMILDEKTGRVLFLGKVGKI